MKSEVMVGNKAVAYATKLARANLIAAYPITPQTTIVEYLSEFVAAGDLKAEYVAVEGEITAQLVCLSGSIAGARTFTATSGEGLLYMSHALHHTARYWAPVVMAVCNRSVRTMQPDHTDLLAQRETGWIQLYCENNQEVLDTGIMAYKIAEDDRVRLPVAYALDGYVLSFTAEPVEIPEQEKVDAWLPPFKTQYPVLPETWDHDLEEYKKHWAQGKSINEPFTAWAGDENFSHLTMIGWKGHDLQWRWRAHQEAMIRARNVIREVNEDYGRQFGRSYGNGLLEEYRTEDADAVIVAMGTLSSTSRAAVDNMRKEGKRIGLVKLKSYRPFPDEEFREIAKRIHTIGVIDRNISLGENGIAYGSIRSAVYDMEDRPKVLGYYAGLAGREVRVRDIEKAANLTLKGGEAAPTWIG